MSYKYLFEFSGEFETVLPKELTPQEIEDLKQGLKKHLPLTAAGARVDVTLVPTNKTYRVAYRDIMMNYEIVEASDLVEASKIFNERHFNTCVIEEIEEVK